MTQNEVAERIGVTRRTLNNWLKSGKFPDCCIRIMGRRQPGTFDPEKVDLFFESKAGKIQLIENGVALDYSEKEATKILSEPEVTAIADVKMGKESATAWGCDLTYDYVKINGDYRS